VASVEGADFIISEKNIPISAILAALRQYAEIEGALYDPELYSTITQEDRAAEIIREESISRLMQEIPHALYVRLEDVERRQNRVRMLAYVVVETESQKKILIGTKGSKISEIGQASRARIGEVYDCPVDLILRVATEPGWTKNTKILQTIFPNA
jgi:GTP-binding protein Era